MQPLLSILRVLASPRRGSSRPILVDTPDGKHLVKLRGAAQGSAALVAEVIVSALAEALGLPVLPWRVAVLDNSTPCDDRDDELADLLVASIGPNLAFRMLESARDARLADCVGFTPRQKAAILWLDRLVFNPDRTLRNANILYDSGRLYLIDHGSSLRFQYNWAGVTEASPREVGATADAHIFESISEISGWSDYDAAFADAITRAVLEDAVAAVPASFIEPLLTETGRQGSDPSVGEAIRRRRAAYVAFLWKRLKPPRAFASQPRVLRAALPGGKPPSWLTSGSSRWP